jgi:hypothetical protein
MESRLTGILGDSLIALKKTTKKEELFLMNLSRRQSILLL